MSQTLINQSTTQSAAETLGGAQSDLLGLAVLGKTALALAIVIGVILLCSALLKRIGPARGRQGQHLKVVASTAVGQRERVVIVEVKDTWLVLGVGGGKVNSLHEMPAPPTDTSTPEIMPEGGGFAARFATALRHNTRASFSRKTSHDRSDGGANEKPGGDA
ncbi:flagellar protein FliO/FliZ [Modicisalibacter muralis]|uniref:Flagellar protein n=1 Tax=Modicisalibacter muralis TaxID=119000 RepID=A0A1G9FU61_9GAMM|nr:flagellar biosynthetic protein FliO [Halomonas muralis]SDK91966.1 flagellar protein FliO/FliZ [Halomonas muralis]